MLVRSVVFLSADWVQVTLAIECTCNNGTSVDVSQYAGSLYYFECTVSREGCDVWGVSGSEQLVKECRALYKCPTSYLNGTSVFESTPPSATPTAVPESHEQQQGMRIILSGFPY